MSIRDEFDRLIEKVESASYDSKVALFAYSDIEEECFRKFLPGTKVIRCPRVFIDVEKGETE